MSGYFTIIYLIDVAVVSPDVVDIGSCNKVVTYFVDLMIGQHVPQQQYPWHRHENDNSSTAHQFSCCMHRLISGIWVTFSRSNVFSWVRIDFV